jgi:hypothetical protein
MLWLLIIVVIIIISFLLALRSMRNYQEIPPARFSYGLYLICNSDQLQNGVLNKLYAFGLESNAQISIEKLFKGGESAIVIYAPHNIGQFVPELELLEIEDYLEREAKSGNKKASVDEVIVWSLQPKSEVELEIPPDFLKDFPLEQNQQLFWQLVLASYRKEHHFQVNIRVMVADHDTHQRIELAKNVDQYLEKTVNLHKKETNQSISLLFDRYQKRALTPSEIEGFILSSQKVKELL